MIGKVCKCDSYMRRATARKLKINHNLIMKKKDVPLGKSKGISGSAKCRHLLIEKVDKVKLLYCTAGSEVRLIDGCPRSCRDRE